MINEILQRLERSIGEWCCGDRDSGGDWKMRLARMICEDHREEVEKVVRAVEGDQDRPTIRLHRGCGESPDVWLLVWREINGEGEKTEIHDHGPSEVAVKMVCGRMREVEMGGENRETILDCDGECEAEIPSPYIHQCSGCDSGKVGASIHVYHPPLQEMGIYEMGGDGKLTKTETWRDPEGCTP